MTDDQTEEDRQGELEQARLTHPDIEKQFGTGSLGQHELIHTLFIVQSVWDDFILNHPACLLRKEAYRKADQVSTLVAELYAEVATEDSENKSS